MAEHDFLVKLTHFANTAWPTVRLGHSVGAFDEKYPCANPEGPVDNSDCDDDDPFCNCPECTKHLDPSNAGNLVDFPWYIDMQTGWGLGAYLWNWVAGNDEPVIEPTKEELKESTESIKECELIEGHSLLGPDYLGCIWNNQDHPSSCNCPCVGEKFKDYMEISRTYSTYWNTPPTTPLWRDAQMKLINSQSAAIILDGDLTLRPGELINIIDKVPVTNDNKDKRSSGRWLVSDIGHNITKHQHHTMNVGLVRDSSPISPEESESYDWLINVLVWLIL